MAVDHGPREERREQHRPKARDLRREAGSPFAPWAGAIGAALAALPQQQGLGNALRFQCTINSPFWGLFTGGLSLALIAIGALISWRVFSAHAGDTNEHSTRRFIASLSLLCSALASGLVLFMTLAAAIVPPCPP
jgi:hypothetical protein